ncbi:MAG: T9SS type A sorting domain-containing protein [candidate division WOR-3 bacterium]|nr:T9SS type A sorting domain-containing protein [candidate division WOR-3 bacterium]
MNLLFILMPLLLQSGIIKEPFRIAESEPKHHQVSLRAAMAPDGYFAILWRDSLPINNHHNSELELFVRFFDRDGDPLGDAYKIAKLTDTTTWVYHPCLAMDSAGNAILLWVDNKTTSDKNLSNIRFQRFAPDGSSVGFAQTLVPQTWLAGPRPIGLGLANNGEFAVTWAKVVGREIWVQRFNREGYPKNRAFLAHDDLSDTGDFSFNYPQVALNDAGDLVVTWLEVGRYPRFQVFDAADESILPWEPMGYLVNEDSSSGCRVEPYWLDNDRFVLFWIDKAWPWYLVGRVFADRGLTRYPICRLVHDSLGCTWVDPAGPFAVAMSSDERFAETHTRSYVDRPDTSDPSKKRWWDHGAGILGYIQDNEPIRRTTLFEYTPPWGADTVNSLINNRPHVQPSAVGACDDRIVWVYSRLNTDTIFEAYALITDWDMGVGVAESPIQTESPIQLSASLNRLFYDVSGSVTGEAKLTLYSVDGRKVLTETIKGKGIWDAPALLPAGVYFARVVTENLSARSKVVVVK